MHVSQDSSAFMADDASDTSSFQGQISGYAAGTAVEQEEFKNHYGREFYKKLDLLGVSHSHSVGPGFRPTNLAQIYTL